MARHPSEYYIRCLILERAIVTVAPKDEARNLDIMRILNLQGLRPTPTADYLNELAADTLQDLPTEFNPHNSKHKPSMEHLRRQRVYSMFQKDDDSRAALELLRGGAQRDLATKMIVGRMPETEIAYQLNLQFDTDYTLEAVKLFSHYFLNRAGLTEADWDEYLNGSHDYVRQHGLVKLDEAYTLHVIRAAPILEAKEMALTLLNDLYFRCRAILALPITESSSKMLGVSINAFLKVLKRAEKSDLVLQDLLKEFAKFIVETNQTNPKAIEELTPTELTSLIQHKRLAESPFSKGDPSGN